jgi:hypothetical protein
MSKGCGGRGRNWLAESIANDRTRHQCGSTASMYAGGVGTHVPGAAVTVYFGKPRVCGKESFAAQVRMCCAIRSP